MRGSEEEEEVIGMAYLHWEGHVMVWRGGGTLRHWPWVMGGHLHSWGRRGMRSVTGVGAVHAGNGGA